ncbi:DUF4865 family protein [Noviherbaspirillum galbum]|uniref:DUF4865 family protein n=1 Tax=Noviherbaspirillum galbum TaxID=2709383 RepID=A0A6B3SNS7_9BURK|nr:DUF4865 family protein [Noviherbaspirillum galbum]NEX62393.1 DUF4865 family protein [Noviherbaspirillum galbum]
MIAMQYNLVLPADYDMGIIERRIAERGHATDGFPGLAFKAYLHAGKGDETSSADNVYAPFYLWHTVDGMNDFLCGPGFVGLTQSFGWPAVQRWNVWHAEHGSALDQARYATREILPIQPHADLGALRRAEIERSSASMADRGVLASLAGFEPADWSLVRFRLWSGMPGLPEDERGHGRLQIYRVGHVSLG